MFVEELVRMSKRRHRMIIILYYSYRYVSKRCTKGGFEIHTINPFFDIVVIVCCFFVFSYQSTYKFSIWSGEMNKRAHEMIEQILDFGRVPHPPGSIFLIYPLHLQEVHLILEVCLYLAPKGCGRRLRSVPQPSNTRGINP